MKQTLSIMVGAFMIGLLLGCGNSMDNNNQTPQKNSGEETKPVQKGIVAGDMQPSIIKQDSKDGRDVYKYTLKNQTEEEQSFTFSSGKKIDFELKNEEGESFTKIRSIRCTPRQ